MINNNPMQKITPHLWFDTQAVEAAEFYVKTFPDSKVTFKTEIKNTPSGDCDIVGFTVMSYEFMAISAGPLFKFNPSISFHLKFKTPEEVDAIWGKLLPGGTVMMELGEYPFSKRYGWIQDKFGVSWQIIQADGEFEQQVVPVLMFTQDNCGKAEAAMNDYASIFPNSKATVFMRYGEGESPDKPGTVKYGQLLLEGEEFGIMESAHDHKFTFNEAISLIVNCKDQAEIDYFWEKLSAVPEADLPAPQPNTFYVYVIMCDDDSMYIGQTQDILERWRKHNKGLGAEHTKKHKPDRIIHFEEFSSREEAVKREHDLKTGFGRKWLKREWKAGRTRQAGQCGWLKDKYGLSWQIIPQNMGELVNSEKTTQAMLKMKKIVIEELKKLS